MMVLNLQLVQIGNSISYWTGLLTPIIVFTLQNKDISQKDKDSWALYAMITLGFGQMFGGLIMGLLIDRIGSKKTSLINVGLLAVTTILSLVVIYQVSYNYVTFTCCFFWGLSDGALNIHSFKVLGSELVNRSPFHLPLLNARNRMLRNAVVLDLFLEPQEPK